MNTTTQYSEENINRNNPVNTRNVRNEVGSIYCFCYLKYILMNCLY